MTVGSATEIAHLYSGDGIFLLLYLDYDEGYIK